MVGLLPILPAVTVPRQAAELGQALGKQFARFLANAGRRPRSAPAGAGRSTGRAARLTVLSLLPPVRLERVLGEVARPEDEFLSPHGLRALSRRHRDQPFQHRRSRA